MSVELKPGERLDDLQTGGYALIQHPDCFRFGTDSVLLANFAAPRMGERAVDMGCGTGAVMMLMAAHREDLEIDGIEIQERIADMAARSVQMNGLQERIRVHCMDMRLAHQALGLGQKSLAVCNPPYGKHAGAIPNASQSVTIARHEGDLIPEEIAEAAARLLKFGGRFCVVYPAPRAYEMMRAMEQCGLAPKRIRIVQSRLDRVPKLVLLEAVKGGGSGLHWLAPLIMYAEDGQYSPEMRKIYHMNENQPNET